ncbi:MAG TPA: STAS domain-containing protein [Candidatus Kapabacteria bacterium]|nr:STAS domain-containing protein [Candidatus Kapabacteria bacterium]
MHFTTDQRKSKTIFRLKEERLDSRNAGQLKAEFLILAQPGTNAIIVDLSEVQHVDSAGLSALLLGQRQMRLNGGELRLAGLNESVRTLLDITQLNRMFPIFATVQEAMNATFGFFPGIDGTESFADDEDDEAEENRGTFGDASGISDVSGTSNLPGIRNHVETEQAVSLGPTAPSAKAIRAGAIAAGGSFGAAALTNIMMTPDTFELNDLALLDLGEDEDDDDDEDHDLDDIDDLEQDFTEDDDEDDDDLDEEDDVEDDDEAVVEDVKEEDIEEVEDLDEDFEDDDWDEEELEEDEEEDY